MTVACTSRLLDLFCVDAKSSCPRTACPLRHAAMERAVLQTTVLTSSSSTFLGIKLICYGKHCLHHHLAPALCKYQFPTNTKLGGIMIALEPNSLPAGFPRSANRAKSFENRRHIQPSSLFLPQSTVHESVHQGNGAISASLLGVNFSKPDEKVYKTTSGRWMKPGWCSLCDICPVWSKKRTPRSDPVRR